MALIRCPKCGQAYDVPGAIAVRLPSSIATCHCGEWLAGSKAAVLARVVDADQLRTIDMEPYRLRTDEDDSLPERHRPTAAAPRSVRIVARSSGETTDQVFTIRDHPLWIGRKGCHVALEEAELSIRHCSISVEGDDLVVRDADSHLGTYLDGAPVDEAVIEEGVHLLRLGSALLSIEPVQSAGDPVEPIALGNVDLLDPAMIAQRLGARAAAAAADAESVFVLTCVEGPLVGQEFEIPAGGLIVGREGHVRVPDEYLSRRHFEVTHADDGTIRVRDLQSRNGTFLNTLPAKNTRVQSGDEIRAGVNRFRVEQRTQAASEPGRG